MASILVSLVLGPFAGVFGALFVSVNSYLGAARKYYITQNWMKVVEAGIFAILTTTAFYWTPYIFAQCIPLSSAPDQDLAVRYNCKED